jgi:hypothetical protein
MRAAHGAERAADILQRSPQNSVFYPSLSRQGFSAGHPRHPPAGGRPHAGRGLELSGGGRARAAVRARHDYNRLVFSPMSVVAHDDVHLFESIQQGLRAGGNEWVSLHRNYDAAELAQPTITTNGTNELLMRNQFRAWAKSMAAGTEAAP